MVDWERLKTPLGLPGQTRAICTRTSYDPIDPASPPKDDEVRFYACSLPLEKMAPAELAGLVRQHWMIENGLHHVKDRTWLEDRHWMGNQRTAAVVAMLRSVACGLVRSAKGRGMKKREYCPARIEYFNQRPTAALKLVVAPFRL